MRRRQPPTARAKIRLGAITRPTLKATAASNPSANRIGRPGKTTGREVISSCSLAKVTTEPAKLTEPTRIVNAVATNSNTGAGTVVQFGQLEQGDEGRGAAADTVEQRHQLRHLGHLHPVGAEHPDGRASAIAARIGEQVLDVSGEKDDHAGEHRARSADQVAAARGLG